MPNWVKVYIRYPAEHAAEVEKSIYNADKKVDFRILLPYNPPHELERIRTSVQLEVIKLLPVASMAPKNGNALNAMELLLTSYYSSLSAVISIQWREAARKLVDDPETAKRLAVALDAGEVTEGLAMLENIVATGYMHSLDFARSVWCTKWNACHQQPVEDQVPGVVIFHTAWSCPVGWLIKLTQTHRTVQFDVCYADEDIGRNVGLFRLLDGWYVQNECGIPSHLASSYADPPEDVRHWKKVARKIWNAKPGFKIDKLFKINTGKVDTTVDVPWVA